VARKNPSPEASDSPSPPFEEALARLEQIVEELEGGELTLDQSLARYEEGVQLSRRLTQTLDQAEQRIEKLVDGQGGEPATEPAEPELKGPESEGNEGQLPF
jgi:exodeoxyribonuclease VII small subunit